MERTPNLRIVETTSAGRLYEVLTLVGRRYYHSPIPTHHSPLTTHQSPLTTPHSPLPTHHSPLTTPHSPLTTHHSPLPTHHSPFTTHHSPITHRYDKDLNEYHMSHLTIEIADFARDFSVISAIRKTVFHQEQQVEPELDFDGKDENCLQLIAYLDGESVGTARIRYLDEKTAKIERLAVLATVRGQGVAKKLMTKALEVIAQQNINSQQNIIAQQNIIETVVHAQEYIKGLYEQLGFEQEGEVFVEAGINHVKMKKKFK